MLLSAILLAAFLRCGAGLVNLYDGVQPMILSLAPATSSIMGGNYGGYCAR